MAPDCRGEAGVFFGASVEEEVGGMAGEEGFRGRTLYALGVAAAISAACGTVSLPPPAKGRFIEEDAETLVRVGMSQEDVVQAIGVPSENNRFPTGTTIWTYVVLPVGQQVFFDVQFDGAGRVKRTEVRVPGVS